MVKKTVIHSFRVEYEDDAHEGIEYLRDHLSPTEAKVFFEAAKKKKSCEFEDRAERNYTLWHRPNDSTYILTRRVK